jgi:hypothetical protein
VKSSDRRRRTPRQIDEHDDGQREKADRHQAVGRPDQDRQRAGLGVVQTAEALMRSPTGKHGEQQRDHEGK